jgi:hypothetical protein
MRDGSLPLGLAFVGSVALLACGQAFELTGGTATSTGAGGATSSASVGGSGGMTASSGGGDTTTTSTTTSTTTTASTGGGQCTKNNECMGPTSLCGYAACQGGLCGIHGLQGDGPSTSQLYGDCQLAVCSSGKLSFMAKDQDIYDDGNPCTTNTCESGSPKSVINKGAKCNGANYICDGQGACVECTANDTSNCDGGKPLCIAGHCAPDTCDNQALDSDETAVDCGGVCPPCADGNYCLIPQDCKSDVCAIPVNENKLKCITPSCGDMVKNGKESDVDCGGPDCQTRCLPTKKCTNPSDCLSGVCHAGICQAATCTDGVKNGFETGIDCGLPSCVVKNCPGG